MYNQENILIKLKILVALISPMILYWQDLIFVANEALKSELSTHILIIPFLLIYILYRLRVVFSASTSELFVNAKNDTKVLFKDVIGVLLCLLAYIIKWYGSYTFMPLEYHIASIPIFVTGIILIIFNFRILRILSFPIIFLIFLLPPPFEFTQIAGAALSQFSTQAAYTILKTLGFSVILMYEYSSPVIFLKTQSGVEIPFAIDIACSGINSLIGFTIFAIFIAYIARSPYRKKIIILLLGFPLIYALNILRITILIVIGYFFGPKLALNIFHLIGGWTFILVGTLLLLIILEKFVKIQIFGNTPIKKCPYCAQNTEEIYCINCGKKQQGNQNSVTNKTDIIKLSLILTITISLLFIQVPVIALTEGAAEVLIKNPTGEQITTEILPEIEGYELRFFYRDYEFENISHQDASLIYQYNPVNISERPIWVGLEISGYIGNLHRWEACLITIPQTEGKWVRVTQLDLRDVRLLDNPPLYARYFAFQEKGTNSTEVILYWYTKSIFNTERGYEPIISKISVIAYTQNPLEYRAVEDDLLPIAMAISDYWKPLNTWSWAAIAIAENGPILIMISATLLLLTLIWLIYIEINKRRAAKNLYTQISDSEERQIFDAIKAVEKGLVNESKIVSKYREISKSDIDIVKLHRKLVEAEKAGLIERKIININDEPFITWKLNF